VLESCGSEVEPFIELHRQRIEEFRRDTEQSAREMQEMIKRAKLETELEVKKDQMVRRLMQAHLEFDYRCIKSSCGISPRR
jgi:hypothetical protein